VAGRAQSRYVFFERGWNQSREGTAGGTRHFQALVTKGKFSQMNGRRREGKGWGA